MKQPEEYLYLMENNPRFSSWSRERKIGLISDLLNREYMDLCNDWAFKKVFSRDKEVLKMLLNDILPVKITDIEFEYNELKESRDDKKVIMDLFCRTGEGQHVIVEMQTVNHSRFLSRLLYYSAKAIATQKNAGEKDFHLDAVYVIAITNFERRHPKDTPNDQLLFEYTLSEKTVHETLTKDLSFYILELPRVARIDPESANSLSEWCEVLGNMTKFAEERLDNPGRMGKLMNLAKTKGLTDEEMAEYLNWQFSEKHLMGYREAGYEDGHYDGLEEGEAKGQSTLIKAMMANGMSAEQISAATNLAIEEVRKLAV